MAHLTGFAMGVLAGVAHARWRVPRGGLAQYVAGLAALATIAGAWMFALGSA
jgi:hypothetical protein